MKTVSGMVFAVEFVIFPNFINHFQFIWGEPAIYKLWKLRHWDLTSFHAGIINITVIIAISIVIMLIGYVFAFRNYLVVQQNSRLHILNL